MKIAQLLNVSVYLLGWALFVLNQANNSIRSSSNGLQGRAGWAQWFGAHAIDLATRLFFSGIAYGFILHTVTDKMQVLGFPLSAAAIAGIGGFGANTLLYQFFGYIPFLRVESSLVAPPMNPPVPPQGPKE
jgi:hypothetical protein